MALAQCLEEHLEVLLVDLQYTEVKRTMASPRITPSLRIHKRQPKLAAKNLISHKPPPTQPPLTSCAHRHNQGRP